MLIPIDKLDTAFKLVCNDAKGNKQVIIFASSDVDSLCATKILTELFRTESVQYTIKTVSTYEDIIQALQYVNDEFCAVFFVNCGASADINANFPIDSEAIFYVCDSHLPFHPANVEDQERVISLISFVI